MEAEIFAAWIVFAGGEVWESQHQICQEAARIADNCRESDSTDRNGVIGWMMLAGAVVGILDAFWCGSQGLWDIHRELPLSDEE